MNNLSNFFKRYDLTNDQSTLVQELDKFLSSNESTCFLLKGYAGTGKTFITKGLTEYLKEIRRNYILAAPTGKAAKVIQEKTQSEAYTIHKTIYSSKDIKEYKSEEDGKTIKFYFELATNDNSDDTVYIFDEASMISNVYSEMEFIRFGSGHLLQDLFKYINLDNNDHNKKIIFIGDSAQLPPVGMNFSPALDSQYLKEKFGIIPIEFELTQVVRQKENSGILKNSIALREKLKNKIFNQLDIDTSTSDIESLEHENFIKKYLEVSGNKIDKNTMVIAYTNVSVRDYNQAIRKHFFKDIKQINIGDKIMILSNNAQYEIFLSNGDFGLVTRILSDTEHKAVTLKRKNKETGIVEKIVVDLYFRDIELLARDIDGTLYKIRCKIIENLLFSEQPSLSSDENKAIYVDFMIRNNHLKPNTKEWKDALKSDPYFNALKVKFGYAITCHKAQGSEWKNIFLNCKSHQSYLSERYFRWLYTALTRASKNLYTLDEPHFGLTDKLKNNNIHIEHIQDSFTPTKLIQIDIQEDNPFNISNEFLLSIYQNVVTIAKAQNIKILDIQHNQNQEQYLFESNNEHSKVAIYYNAKDIVTTINPVENNNLSNLIKAILEPLKNHILTIGEHSDFSFTEQFLEDFYLSLKNILDNQKITIANIEHLNYMERYTFSRNNEIAIIDFYYNGKGQFTRTTPNNRSNSRELIQNILGSL